MAQPLCSFPSVNLPVCHGVYELMIISRSSGRFPFTVHDVYQKRRRLTKLSSMEERPAISRQSTVSGKRRSKEEKVQGISTPARSRKEMLAQERAQALSNITNKKPPATLLSSPSSSSVPSSSLTSTTSSRLTTTTSKKTKTSSHTIKPGDEIRSKIRKMLETGLLEALGPNPDVAFSNLSHSSSPTNSSSSSSSSFSSSSSSFAPSSSAPASPQELASMAQALAQRIETALFEMFHCVTNQPYRDKARDLVFNVKDKSNADLNRSLFLGVLSPESLVAMSPQEMASEALKRKRKREQDLAKLHARSDVEMIPVVHADEHDAAKMSPSATEVVDVLDELDFV